METIFSPDYKAHVRQRANAKTRKLLQRRLALFVKNPHDPLLRIHELQGQWVGHKSFDIDEDYRIIFKEEGRRAKLVAFGTHNDLYRSWMTGKEFWTEKD